MTALPVLATTPDVEIKYLLDVVGDSGCTFNRNGKEHTADEARDHLAMKYRRAGSRIKTAESFIKYLASESSWTGKPYMIECNGASIPSRDWLTDRLTTYRTTAAE
ncbi:MAG: DUF5329 domain-containing protein [Gammaproteobacteria bacterium]|nr:DUF5329 domain-containing protein [Gammaproteobacteria bacterium]NND37937.1 DUF5329 domain-containing protein [Gammaproteobacteria bacterium]